MNTNELGWGDNAVQNTFFASARFWVWLQYLT